MSFVNCLECEYQGEWNKRSHFCYEHRKYVYKTHACTEGRRIRDAAPPRGGKDE